ncbi:MAG TPA: hypothetical protein VJ248_09700 [Candidatus Udaeobacter sp.]|nr:hypothetical protein [Candidatus Udaeobacter sp.]
MAQFSDEELTEMHDGWIETRNAVRRIIPQLESQGRKIRALEDSQLQEQGRIDAAANKAVAFYIGRKGQKVRDWMPLLVSLVASGLLFLGTILTQPQQNPISMEDLKTAIQAIMQEDKP